MKMSNRQIDWYNAERRFIWACENAADKKKAGQETPEGLSPRPL